MTCLRGYEKKLFFFMDFKQMLEMFQMLSCSLCNHLYFLKLKIPLMFMEILS
jgi:hypothetical protein